ncbi:MAG: SusC/RagA family TonB-linked outer membrane protein, partial [Prevotellaceae bacterium]|nr:SusC/RagA family TonB-linked outer membrane protein [Prevotellaceae bacterium]
GSTGKATVNFDAYYGFSGKPTYYNGMTGDEWTNYQREAYKYLNGQYPTDMSAIITDPVNLQHFNNNDWIDWEDQLLQGTATTQKYTLSVSGGSEKTKLFASLSFENNEGLLPGESLKNYGLRLNIDQQIFRWAKVGFTSNLSYSDKNTGTQKAFTTALSAFPLGAMRNDKGELNYEYATGEFTPLGDFLPYQFADNTKQTIVRPTGYLELTPLKGLTFKSTLGALLSHSKRGQYWGEQATSLRPTYAGSPYAEVNATDQWQYTWDNVLSYTHTFAGVHNVSGTLVSTYTHDVVETTTTGGSGQNIDSWFWHSLGSAAGQHIDSTYKQYQKMGYALRLNYSYAGRYLITFSNRWDGVSWLSPGHKWDSFPAGAIAWRISDEPFMASASHWIDNLKLRMGYGVTGNSGGVGPYGTGSKPIVYSGSGISVDGKIGSFAQYTETYGNPSLGWEKSDNLNVGLDFTLLKGRIDGSIDWFNTKTRGLLFKRTMPITGGVTGWGSPLASWENIAKTENKGLEITLNTRNIQTKTFTWSSNLTLTWGKEKITSLPSGDLINESLFIGQPIHAIYGYKYAGIWASDTPADVLAAYGVKPGWVKIETVEQADDGGVHKYSDKDRQVVGHNNPNLILGFNNTLSWKGIDLTLYLMARYGQTITSKLLGWYTAKTGNANNQIAGADYWTQDNQSAYYPVPGSGSEQNVMTALTYRDGSFIKVKNITLGYTLPASLSRHLYMNRLRLYATAYNPFIYVKDKQLKGTDPENNGADSFPLYKQFVFGINITF